MCRCRSLCASLCPSVLCDCLSSSFTYTAVVKECLPGEARKPRFSAAGGWSFVFSIAGTLCVQTSAYFSNECCARFTCMRDHSERGTGSPSYKLLSLFGCLVPVEEEKLPDPFVCTAFPRYLRQTTAGSSLSSCGTAIELRSVWCDAIGFTCTLLRHDIGHEDTHVCICTCMHVK